MLYIPFSLLSAKGFQRITFLSTCNFQYELRLFHGIPYLGCARKAFPTVPNICNKIWESGRTCAAFRIMMRNKMAIEKRSHSLPEPHGNVDLLVDDVKG